MQKSGRGQSESLFRAQYAKAFEQYNLLTLKSCVRFSEGLLSGPGVSFTPARRSAQDFGAHSYYSGYVFIAHVRNPYKVFQEGFESSPMQMVKQAGSSGNRLRGGVIANLSAIAAGYFMVQDLGAYIYVYLIDATSYSGMLENKPKMTALHRRVERDEAQSCEVLYTHPIFSTDIVGCVWPTDFPGPSEATKYWFPRVAIGPAELSLAVNPAYDKGMEGAEEAARLFSIG